MGNFLGSCAFRCSKKTVLQVMKMNDGKMLEFGAPIRVRDLLVKYPNSYVVMFKEATQPLPLDYELKLGKVCYLFPCFSTTFKTSANVMGGDVSSSIREGGSKDGARRIKLVITRQQLEQLLSNQITLKDVMMEVNKRPSKWVISSTSNEHKLEAIPEEVEGVY